MGEFNLANRIKIVNPSPNVDLDYGVYFSLTEARQNVDILVRELGKTVGIIQAGKVEEYWWESGILDEDLVLKTVNQNNKIKPVYYLYDTGTFPELSNIINEINNRDSFEITDKEIPLLIVTPLYGNFYDGYVPQIKKYFFSEKGKGFYGQNGIQLLETDLELIYNQKSNSSDFINLPTTQTINLGDITGQNISSIVNSLTPSVLIQGQDKGYRIVKTINDSKKINYLFLADGGIYGLEDLQTNDLDFQVFSEDSDGNTISTIGDFRERLTYVDTNIFIVPENLKGIVIAREQTWTENIITDFTYVGTTLTINIPLEVGEVFQVTAVIASGTFVADDKTDKGGSNLTTQQVVDLITNIDLNSKTEKGGSTLTTQQVVDLANTKQIKDNQIIVSASTDIQPSWNGQTIIFDVTCTITANGVLPEQFSFNAIVLAGVEVTHAKTGTWQWLFGSPVKWMPKNYYNFSRLFNTVNLIISA